MSDTGTYLGAKCVLFEAGSVGNGVRSRFPASWEVSARGCRGSRYFRSPGNTLATCCFCSRFRCTTIRRAGGGGLLSAALTPGTWPGFCAQATRLGKSRACKGRVEGFRARLTEDNATVPFQTLRLVNLVSLG